LKEPKFVCNSIRAGYRWAQVLDAFLDPISFDPDPTIKYDIYSGRHLPFTEQIRNPLRRTVRLQGTTDIGSRKVMVGGKTLTGVIPLPQFDIYNADVALGEGLEAMRVDFNGYDPLDVCTTQNSRERPPSNCLQSGALRPGWELANVTGEKTIGLLEHAWEGGNGFPDCPCAERAMPVNGDGNPTSYAGTTIFLLAPNPPGAGPSGGIC
jgi:hypothetical protein